MDKEALNVSTDTREKGPHVKLDERYRILGELAAAYAASASKEIGLQKANDNPRIRSELNKRYGKRTKVVVKKAHQNAKEGRVNAEANVRSLVQSKALVEAGFPIDPEWEDQKMLIALRRAIGSGRPDHERVQQKDRDAFMERIYRPPADSNDDQQKTA